jgi:hypothetical protein
MKFSRYIHHYLHVCIISGLLFLVTACENKPQYFSNHSQSRLVKAIEFDLESIISMAPGSDNWAITWADDDSQYTTWGDGGGFGGNNRQGRVSMGIAQIKGPVDEFTATNIWGGHNSLSPAEFAGKSYGILAVGGRLWLWRSGIASNKSSFRQQELYLSKDYGRHWNYAGVRFTDSDFDNSTPFFAPTFLQAGPGYSGSPDDFVYIYAPNVTNDTWNVQIPGEISLIRVPRDSLNKKDSYEFFSGLDEQGHAIWREDISHRKSIFTDIINGVMRSSVSYNAGLRRYFLITQQVSRFSDNGHIGIYESEFPWGPWNTVLFDSPWKLGLQNGEKSVFWNFSNKWTDSNGKDFSLVYTGPGSDCFGVVRGRFVTRTDNIH